VIKLPYCPNCGKELPFESAFCINCGHSVKITPGAPSVGAFYVDVIRRLINERKETDYIMPIWLPYVSIIIPVVGFLVVLLYTYQTAMYYISRPLALLTFSPTGFVSSIQSLLLISSLIALAISLFVLYKWINRLNQHLERTGKLYDNASSFINSKGYTDLANNLKNWIQTANIEVKKKNTAAYVAAIGVFYLISQFLYLTSIIYVILIIYVLHFLNKSFHRYDSYEKAIWDGINDYFKKIGRSMTNYPISKIGRLPSRGTAVYIVLTIITLGIFYFYWIYTVTKDPNEHFKSHALVEQEFADLITTV